VAQRIIGVTGGIATGKSTVAKYLEIRYSLPILDADIYARDAVTPELLNILQARYGSGILQGDRSLNRTKLGTIIFNDPQERAWLESQIHPYVRDRLELEAKLLNPKTVVMVVPLLFEAGMQDLVTEIWVVACEPELEVKRLRQRDRLTLEAAQSRINSQMPMAAKKAIADFVLDNSTSIAELHYQIDKLMGASC
jgi:dephospho-CoA kinase